MTPAAANGQPAAAAYTRGPDGEYHAHGVHVLSVTERGIARITVFLSAGVVRSFGLPTRASAAAVSATHLLSTDAGAGDGEWSGG